MNDAVKGPVERFAKAVMDHGDSMKRGGSDPGQHVRAYVAAFEELCCLGDQGRGALSSLFTHPRADVRIAAAAFLLRYDHNRAKRVLETEAKRTGPDAFVASQALKRWEDGTWDLDPE
jgi:hypothetical protein